MVAPIAPTAPIAPGAPEAPDAPGGPTLSVPNANGWVPKKPPAGGYKPIKVSGPTNELTKITNTDVVNKLKEIHTGVTSGTKKPPVMDLKVNPTPNKAIETVNANPLSGKSVTPMPRDNKALADALAAAIASKNNVNQSNVEAKQKSDWISTALIIIGIVLLAGIAGTAIGLFAGLLALGAYGAALGIAALTAGIIRCKRN